MEHNINFSRCNPLAGSSYIDIPKELNQPKKSLINTQNLDDNECFKCCLVIYLRRADHHLVRIEKLTKILQENLILKI